MASVARRDATSLAVRDAGFVTGGLLVAVYVGSERLAHVDPALAGYLVATVVAAWGIAYRVSAFWRRGPSAFYGRALLAALRRPRALARALGHAGADLVAQRFVARRHRLRWAAHMLLAWGTLVSFAVTLLLVWGWVRFEAVGERSYHAILWSWRVVRFATDGVAARLVFHTLDLAAAAVVLGGTYFVVARLRHRAAAGFHLRPLLLLLAVAVTGLALPVAGQLGTAWAFPAAAAAHQVTVIALLVALPFGKLLHVFIRPLQVGARLVRADARGPLPCARCGAALAVAAQLAAVEAALAERRLFFAGRPRLCPPCRRRELAGVHSGLLAARFQPGTVSGTVAARLREVA